MIIKFYGSLYKRLDHPASYFHYLLYRTCLWFFLKIVSANTLVMEKANCVSPKDYLQLLAMHGEIHLSISDER